MDEKQFERLASDELERLEEALGSVDGVDVDLADGILTLEFDEGPKVVVNSHSAARQIWVAANLAASHFSPDPKTQRWFDSRSGEELWDRLRSILNERLGRAVQLSR
ncbi:MAG TPA: iron donor protein CyaY [Myxococcales bacterium]|nr:iron donor protein CyaY [Myxococcales bacterium]